MAPLFVLVLIFYFFFVIRLLIVLWMRHSKPMYLDSLSFSFLPGFSQVLLAFLSTVGFGSFDRGPGRQYGGGAGQHGGDRGAVSHPYVVWPSWTLGLHRSEVHRP